MPQHAGKRLYSQRCLQGKMHFRGSLRKLINYFNGNMRLSSMYKVNLEAQANSLCCSSLLTEAVFYISRENRSGELCAYLL